MMKCERGTGGPPMSSIQKHGRAVPRKNSHALRNFDRLAVRECEPDASEYLLRMTTGRDVDLKNAAILPQVS
jgi:hypothetical protein